MDRKKKNIIELTRVGVDECRTGSHLPLRVMLDSVRSLNNVGSVLRTSDAFMVDQVIMCGITGTPPNPEIHKTALGAEDSVIAPTLWQHCANYRPADGRCACLSRHIIRYRLTSLCQS